MKKHEKDAVLQDGWFAVELVLLDPDRYIPVLGSYLDNDTLFGYFIRWHQRGDSSHSSIVFLDKHTGKPVLEIHALEGWGMIPTKPAILARKGARVELREVEDGPSTQEALGVLVPLIGTKYEKPRGFVTKSRREDPTRWFCSEIVNNIFKLQNCPDCFVSPPWARRSPAARKRIGEIKV